MLILVHLLRIKRKERVGGDRYHVIAIACAVLARPPAVFAFRQNSTLLACRRLESLEVTRITLLVFTTIVSGAFLLFPSRSVFPFFRAALVGSLRVRVRVFFCAFRLTFFSHRF